MPPNKTLQTDEAQLISIGPWYRLAANIGASAGSLSGWASQLNVDPLASVSTMYDDDYPPCERTFVTLRVYSESAAPEEISACLGIEPSRSHVRGSHPPTATAPILPRSHGWFLSSEGHVPSRDSRRHIDWLLDRIEPALPALRQLLVDGARADISCFWVRAWGHSGPTLSQRQLSRLAATGLDFFYDIYSRKPEDAG